MPRDMNKVAFLLLMYYWSIKYLNNNVQELVVIKVSINNNIKSHGTYEKIYKYFLQIVVTEKLLKKSAVLSTLNLR